VNGMSDRSRLFSMIKWCSSFNSFGCWPWWKSLACGPLNKWIGRRQLSLPLSLQLLVTHTEVPIHTFQRPKMLTPPTILTV
jgi:hypothetical protein